MIYVYDGFENRLVLSRCIILMICIYIYISFVLGMFRKFYLIYIGIKWKENDICFDYRVIINNRNYIILWFRVLKGIGLRFLFWLYRFLLIICRCESCCIWWELSKLNVIWFLYIKKFILCKEFFVLL